MQVVILCGGKGTRLKKLTEFIPKPLVEIGGKPILWHVMKIYAHYGFTDFILCLGYKGEKIKEYFLKYNTWREHDFTLDLSGGSQAIDLHNQEIENWQITFANTGQETSTGGRIKRIERFIKEDTFFVTYADGVSDIDLRDLLSFHKRKEVIGTMTTVQPSSQFGEVVINNEDLVQQFREKPQLTRWVNGGFFVFNREFFRYLDESCTLEKEPLENLLSDKELAAYKHRGFWSCMDTYKDTIQLNEFWKQKNPPWKVWDN